MQGLPQIGDVLDETYRIESELGRGGFGAVYLARQISMDREVALKVLVAHAMKVEEMILRFRREVMAIRNLGHPNTIRVYDFRDRADGMLYYVMEYVKGPTLKDVMKEGPMSPARVHHILRQVLKSLSEAHSFGIVHRDLKPANIMLAQMHGETDFVKVLDFGIAKIMDGEDGEDRDQLTSAGVLVGTLNYMSPEQIAGGKITGASDLYALALIAIEMLAGKSVFEGTGRWEILHKQISDEPVDIPQVVLDSPLGPVLQKALQKRTHERYARAEDMLAAMDAIGALPRLPLVMPVEGEPTEAEEEVPVSTATPISQSGPITGTAAMRESTPPGRSGIRRVAEDDASVRVAALDEFADEKTQVVDSSPGFMPQRDSPLTPVPSPPPPHHDSGEALAEDGAKKLLPSLPAVAAPAAVPQAAKNRRLIAGAAGAFVAIIALTVFVTMVFMNTPEPPVVVEETPALVATPPAEIADGVEEPVEELEEEVIEPVAPVVKRRQIKVRTGDTRAQLFDGETLVGTTPIRFSVGEEKAYTLKAEGFEDATVTLGTESNDTVEVALIAIEAPAQQKTPAEKPVEKKAPTTRETSTPKKAPVTAKKDALDWVPITPTNKEDRQNKSTDPNGPKVPVF